MEFIREKTKDKPINKKRIAAKIGTAALCGIVFALAAGLIGMLFIPVYKEQMADSGTKETEMEENSRTEEESQTETETEGQEIVIPDVSLSISDYQELQNELYRIGNEANKSIVTVTGKSSGTDWLNNDYETLGQGAGVIISENSESYYILTERKNIADMDHIQVTFINDISADATVLKYDATTGITILTVEKSQLDQVAKNSIKVASIGNSYTVTKGKIVIALGNPLGTNYSILTGNITSTENEIYKADKNYSVFTTDIIANEDASGILINTAGEIVGVVIQDFSGSQDTSTLTAVAISEVNSLIESLSQGKDNPYLGIYVSTVTDKISKAYDIPKGVFVREVATDSPAMFAGLQSGDVIVKINGEDVMSDMLYSTKISSLTPDSVCEMVVKRQNGNEYYEITCQIEVGVLE